MVQARQLTKRIPTSDYFPRWTKREVVETSGRDPLGVSRVSDALTSHLLPKLLHNEDRSLLEQLMEFAGGDVEELHVLSRYYDSKPSLVDVMLRDFRVRRISLHTQNAITTLTPAWLDHQSVKRGITTIQLCRHADREHI
jgi:hypothetical protein